MIAAKSAIMRTASAVSEPNESLGHKNSSFRQPTVAGGQTLGDRVTAVIAWLQVNSRAR